MPVSTQTARIFTPGTEPTDSPIQECPGCATRVDVTRYEPLEKIACPVCEGEMVVKGCIDRFALEAIAGKGGTGMVYQAFDPHLGRRVALKVVRQDKAANEEVLQQMVSEAGVTASINHPHVVRVYSVGNAQGRFFIAMELVSGGSLDELMEKRGRLPETQVLEIAVQIASGLQAAQNAGLVHRDIKPGNILFSDPQTAKVVDFGLALIEQHAVGSNEVWGTPYYMPPERLEGGVEDFRADIYALGATLFHALAGRPPFEAADSAQVALKRLSTPAPSVLTYAPGVSNATAFVIKKMLERDAAERFQSYEELIESLQFARNELGTKPAVKARVVLDSEQQGRSGMWVTLASLGVLVVGCVAAYFLIPKSTSTEAPAPAASPAGTPLASKTETPKPAAAVDASIPSPGIYMLVNRKDGRVLDCAKSSLDSGGEVALWPRSGAPNQQWILRAGPNGTSRFLAFHSFKALDLRAGSSDNNAPITQWNSNSGEAQCWRLRQVEPGWFIIFASKSGKALTALAGGEAIGQRDYSGTPEQQWKLELKAPEPAGLDAIDAAINPKLIPAPPVTARTSTITPSGRFVSIDISGVATADSRRGVYGSQDDMRGAVQAQLRGPVDIAGIPFTILNAARTPNGKDQITLRGGSGFAKAAYPVKVEISVENIPLVRLHVVGGIGGWGYPWNTGKNENLIGVAVAKITVVHEGGKTEDIVLRNGNEITDHVPKPGGDVPGSALIEGFANSGNQLRYFSKAILDPSPVTKLVLESYDIHVAPSFYALTGEKK